MLREIWKKSHRRGRIFLFNASKSFLEQTSRETGFIRDNLEKVFRLIDVLEFMHNWRILVTSVVS